MKLILRLRFVFRIVRGEGKREKEISNCDVMTCLVTKEFVERRKW